MINVIGGVYREKCIKPYWDDVFGSGGRAALAIANMGSKVNLHSYINEDLLTEFKFKTALFPKDIFTISPKTFSEKVYFNYSHGLDPINPPIVKKQKNITLKADNILIFGMLECNFEVNAQYAVYDPQNTFSTQSFSEHGSTAQHLALVLNENEARALNCSDKNESLDDVVDSLHSKEKADVIVVKCGPEGAVVSYSGKKYKIPAFKTEKVWKIGSGDCFSAHFANNWIINKDAPEVAAAKASLATAYYCFSSVLPAPHTLAEFNADPIVKTGNVRNSQVYIASPFFTLPQLWLVEQIKFNLSEMGLNVFSPYHEIGLVSEDNNGQDYVMVCAQDLAAIKNCDIVFAVLDGHDVGTLAEIGHATALNKKIIILSENNKKDDLVMFHNDHTEIINDYVTAIYKTLWATL